MSAKSAFQALVLALFCLSITIVPTVLAQDDVNLSILQWSHFVPRYDEWFDAYAADWGTQNNVSVSVDHINLAELPATLAAEIDAGEGHSIVEFILSPVAYVEGLHDLTDINMAAQEKYGEPLPTCSATSYLPVLDRWYGFTHTYVPDPGDYIISLWTAVGYPNGPSTYAELLDGGTKIKEQFGVPLGIGLSPELDSEMANRAIMWSYGASVQDENENVVLNSPETIEAVNYMAELYASAMTDEVFAWNAASNNQGLIAGDLSYILNSISAYRSQQKIDEESANDIGFSPALAGPAGAFASSHVWSIYVIPLHVQGAELEAAKQFILDHLDNFNDVVYNSELYNFPCYPPTAPDLEGWLANDPFGSMPPDKLKVLEGAAEWGVQLGYPGVANPAIGQVYNEFIISSMFGRVALGEMTAEESVAQAAARVEEIFAEWRARGLVGGGE
ncbi:MAG: ABC transporter substrate-binding protein [Anaerolineae bacterium]|nr:ABC transporter substrate-binding protein [Anaerolineae bacterium]